ncbi:hypothetical protein NECAME_01068 [Necator americanus]|uniref:Uncharacterized protein n=1 Tax=Necator americanus TaxID=51031 RepID=W2SKH9_NECAM|nr:hypothetical protein NECAME_01068 [Necator americanus]ETN70120.1 hypothetical protein NECAME_01068 [Necator americanus]
MRAKSHVWYGDHWLNNVIRLLVLNRYLSAKQLTTESPTTTTLKTEKQSRFHEYLTKT